MNLSFQSSAVHLYVHYIKKSIKHKQSLTFPVFVTQDFIWYKQILHFAVGKQCYTTRLCNSFVTLFYLNMVSVANVLNNTCEFKPQDIFSIFWSLLNSVLTAVILESPNCVEYEKHN